MIDLTIEHLLSLTAAAKLLPPRRRDKRPHVSCMYRWTTTGCRGVILESIQVGGTKCTSTEALQRFFEKLSAVTEGEQVAPHSRTSLQRERAAKKANDELAASGW